MFVLAMLNCDYGGVCKSQQMVCRIVGLVMKCYVSNSFHSIQVI